MQKQGAGQEDNAEKEDIEEKIKEADAGKDVELDPRVKEMKDKYNKIDEEEAEI